MVCPSSPGSEDSEYFFDRGHAPLLPKGKVIFSEASVCSQGEGVRQTSSLEADPPSRQPPL